MPAIEAAERHPTRAYVCLRPLGIGVLTADLDRSRHCPDARGLIDPSMRATRPARPAENESDGPGA